MSWIQKLYETYEQCKGHEPSGSARLMPISHTPQQAHVEITLDADGNFKGARIVQKEETIIPATEKSAGRSGSACAPHALCDIGLLLRKRLSRVWWEKAIWWEGSKVFFSQGI